MSKLFTEPQSTAFMKRTALPNYTPDLRAYNPNIPARGKNNFCDGYS